MIAFAGNGVGNKTASFGTAIPVLVPPHRLGFTRITKLVYTAQGTAHTLIAARPIGRTTANAAAAALATTLDLTAQPGVTGNALAANDLIAIREVDEVTRLYTVAIVPGAYPGTATITPGLVAGVAAGATVWNFGLTSDTDPVIGQAHPSVRGVASVTSTYEDREGGVFASHLADSPILVYSANGTAAGVFEQVSWSYTAN